LKSWQLATQYFRKFNLSIQAPGSIAPLVVLRMVTGMLMLVGTVRFWWLGWIEDHYIQPAIHFSYYGFEWVTVLPAFWMYTLHSIMIAAAFCVVLGAWFRLTSFILFASFTYVELIDLTYYLNHYYFVSILLLLLCFSPAHRAYSYDCFRNASLHVSHIPRGWILLFQFFLGLVYTYAGLAKINHDWLMEALPLKIWLPAHDKVPFLGVLFRWELAPYLFSWGGMLYDCTVVWWLTMRQTRPFAYLLVIVFHLLTGILFQIGMFPFVMIGATLIFFSPEWHQRILHRLHTVLYIPPKRIELEPLSKAKIGVLSLFLLFQLLFPWRYLMYPGNLFWTEEGYRFSWRVMLMEKAGTATFYVKNSLTGREGVVVNSEFLNPHQEKQMAMQPDMILQFAHFLQKHYSDATQIPTVRAEVWVTLNARPSALLFDPTLDLTQIKDSWSPKSWLNPAPQ
jgi:hypothetical protein